MTAMMMSVMPMSSQMVKYVFMMAPTSWSMLSRSLANRFKILHITRPVHDPAIPSTHTAAHTGQPRRGTYRPDMVVWKYFSGARSTLASKLLWNASAALTTPWANTQPLTAVMMECATAQKK